MNRSARALFFLATVALAGCLPNEVDVAGDGRLLLVLDGERRYRFVSSEDDHEVYLVSADLAKVERITENAVWNGYPRFALGGKAVVYAEAAGGNRETLKLFIQDLATRERREVASGVHPFAFPRVSPDGTKVAVAVRARAADRDPGTPGQRHEWETSIAVLDLGTGATLATVDRTLPCTAWVGDDRLAAVNVFGLVKEADKDGLAFGSLALFPVAGTAVGGEPAAAARTTLAHGAFFAMAPLSVDAKGEAVAFTSIPGALPAAPVQLASGQELEHFGVSAAAIGAGAVNPVADRAFFHDAAPGGGFAFVRVEGEESVLVHGGRKRSLGTRKSGAIRFVGPDRVLVVTTPAARGEAREDALLIVDLETGETVDVGARVASAPKKREVK
jgi:hypothetical protein